jgi:hypothetical protein
VRDRAHRRASPQAAQILDDRRAAHPHRRASNMHVMPVESMFLARRAQPDAIAALVAPPRDAASSRTPSWPRSGRADRSISASRSLA